MTGGFLPRPTRSPEPRLRLWREKQVTMRTIVRRVGGMSSEASSSPLPAVETEMRPKLDNQPQRTNTLYSAPDYRI